MVERLSGGVDYRMIFPDSPIWRVRDDPGVGYFFMVASPDPLDLSAFPFDPRFGWDLSAVGEVVYEDPYLAIDDYVARLIPEWEVAPYGLDFVTYHVGDTYTYPRFLCYDCHDARPYGSWNPYSVPCTTYRVVVYDDPYFYPYYRYSGTALVVSRPVVTQPRYAFASRAPGEGSRPVVRARTAPPRRTTVEFKEPAESGVRSIAPQAPQIGRAPASRPTLQRRPSEPASRLPVRTPPSASRDRTPPSPGRSGVPDATIVRPSRPSGSTPSATPRAPSRPSERVTPTRRGGTTPSARPSTRSRPSARPATPSRGTTQQPRARPTVRSAPSRPSARPTSPGPSRQPSASSRPSTRSPAPSRPSVRPATPPRSSGSQRPSASPRSRAPSRR